MPFSFVCVFVCVFSKSIVKVICRFMSIYNVLLSKHDTTFLKNETVYDATYMTSTRLLFAWHTYMHTTCA